MTDYCIIMADDKIETLFFNEKLQVAIITAAEVK